MSPHSTRADASKDIRYINLFHDSSDSEKSALKLVLALFPQWQHEEGKVEFIRFTDGITNTVRCSFLKDDPRVWLRLVDIASEGREASARIQRRADRRRSCFTARIRQGYRGADRQGQ